jgi:hypothetical protein
MKSLALILSFYIMSLAVAPALKLIYAKHVSDHCSKSCSSSTSSDKDADGCPKQTCSPFSCCLKTLVILQSDTYESNRLWPEGLTIDNFILSQIVGSVRGYDIWHPPRIILKT